jgi:type IV pilus assembly protein PilW
MNTRTPHNGNELGMTIVELMVAVAVGLVLMTIAFSIFLSNKQTAEITEDLGRLQESGRFAVEQLSRDLRMAGHWGCHDGGPDAVVNTLNGAAGGSVFNNSNGIEGFEPGAPVAWRPSGGTDVTASVPLSGIVAGTDAVSIRYMSGAGFNPTTAMAAIDSDLQVVASSGFRQGDVLMVSDCQGAHIFQVTNADAYDTGTLSHTADASMTPGNSTADFTAGGDPRTYGTNAMVARMVSTRYYVANGTNGPVLLRTRLAGSGTSSTEAVDEIAEGVETMQILYGEDTDGDVSRSPDAYRDADNVVNWVNVVSIRVGLLLRTVDEYGTQTDSRRYNVNGTVVCPTGDTDASCTAVRHPVDRRRRRVFETTIVIRNLQ